MKFNEEFEYLVISLEKKEFLIVSYDNNKPVHDLCACKL